MFFQLSARDGMLDWLGVMLEAHTTSKSLTSTTSRFEADDERVLDDQDNGNNDDDDDDDDEDDDKGELLDAFRENAASFDENNDNKMLDDDDVDVGMQRPLPCSATALRQVKKKLTRRKL